MFQLSIIVETKKVKYVWSYDFSLKNHECIFICRYEDPDGKNRWDSPLFYIYPETELDTAAIYASLFKKGPPKPNQSTQNPPLSSTNFLYDLDRITKGITDELIKAKNSGSQDEVKIPGCSSDVKIDLRDVSIQRLMLLRRQYITYSKMHTPDVDRIPDLFIHYLKTSLK